MARLAQISLFNFMEDIVMGLVIMHRNLKMQGIDMAHAKYLAYLFDVIILGHYHQLHVFKCGNTTILDFKNHHFWSVDLLFMTILIHRPILFEISTFYWLHVTLTMMLTVLHEYLLVQTCSFPCDGQNQSGRFLG